MQPNNQAGHCEWTAGSTRFCLPASLQVSQGHTETLCAKTITQGSCQMVVKHLRRWLRKRLMETNPLREEQKRIRGENGEPGSIHLLGLDREKKGERVLCVRMCVFSNTLRFFSHSQEHINKNLGNQDQINITSGMEVQSQMFLAIMRQNCVLLFRGPCCTRCKGAQVANTWSEPKRFLPAGHPSLQNRWKSREWISSARSQSVFGLLRGCAKAP